MNPQRQLPAQPQLSAEQIQKNREYLKQQQRLRLMASSTQKTHQVSADSLIQNLLGKKDTFTPMNTMTSAYLPASNEKLTNTSKASPAEFLPGQASSQQVTVDWLSPKSPNFPAMYQRIWVLVGQPDGMADTGRLFPLLLTSGLHTDVLGFIWGLVNRCVAGKLTELELYALLALVGLAQKGYSFNSVDVLSLVPQPPLPNLNLVMEPQTPNKMTREELNLHPQTAAVLPSTIPAASSYRASSAQNPAAQLATAQASITEQPINQNTSTPSDFDDFDDFQSASTVTLDSSYSYDLNITSNTPGSPQQKQSVNSVTSFLAFPAETLKEISAESSSSSTIIPSSLPELSDIPEPIFVQKFPTISVVGGGRAIGSRLANHSLGAPKINKTRHQKHHRNEPIPTSSTTVEDDFSDFQQASLDSNVFSKCSIKPPPTHTYLLKESAIRMETPVSSEQIISKSLNTDQLQTDLRVEDVKDEVKTSVKQSTDHKEGNELMGIEDRYGALRALAFVNDNPAESSDDFGDFFSTEAEPANDSFADIASRSSTTIVDSEISWATADVEVADNVEFEVDDWGSFATASDSVPSVQIPSILESGSNQGIELMGDWGEESSLTDNLATQFTELNLDFKMNPVQGDTQITSVVEFDSSIVLPAGNDIIDPARVFEDSPVASVIMSANQIEDDDFGDFVSTDHTWGKDGNILLESNSWTEDSKEVSNLWLEETKTIEDQTWPEEVKNGQAKITKDGVLDNNLVSNLWLEESKALDNQSVRSLELPGLDQSWNAVGEWRKCLQTCLTILQFAVDTFEAVSDPKVMHEILSSDEAQEYLKGLVEVWAISERLATSCRQSGVEHKLDGLLNSTETAWSLLRPHFTQAQVAVESEMELEGQDPCSVCLGVGAMLEFEGCTYHTSCANLWLHYIDTVLPAIHQP